MKRDILESMDKGVWYSYETLAAMTGFEVTSVNRVCRGLVSAGVIEVTVLSRKSRVRLLMNRPQRQATSYPCVPTVAAGQYRPKWTPMHTYDRYARSHQQLCEELR